MVLNNYVSFCCQDLSRKKKRNKKLSSTCFTHYQFTLASSHLDNKICGIDPDLGFKSQFKSYKHYDPNSEERNGESLGETLVDNVHTGMKDLYDIFI